MFKNILVAALLLAPVLACNGKASTDLSVQIVPAASTRTSSPPPTPPPSSKGIACAIGPNYNGSIPAAAQAAGFTTCAANYDFTTATYANVSIWLDCAGASRPQWFLAYGECGHVTITSDGNVPQVLDVYWDPAELAAGTDNNTVIRTQPNSQTGGTTFPQGTYIEYVMRRTPSGDPCDPNNPAGGSNCILGAFWAYTNTSNAIMEWDFLETYGDPPEDGSATHGQGSCCNITFQPGHQSSYNPTVYNTFGILTTTDGSSTAGFCSVFNGTRLGCSKGTLSPVSVYNNRNYFIVTLGPQKNSVTPNYTAPIHYLIQSIRVWECPRWADRGVANDTNHQCLNNPVIQSW